MNECPKCRSFDIKKWFHKMRIIEHYDSKWNWRTWRSERFLARKTFECRGGGAHSYCWDLVKVDMGDHFQLICRECGHIWVQRFDESVETLEIGDKPTRAIEL